MRCLCETVTIYLIHLWVQSQPSLSCQITHNKVLDHRSQMYEMNSVFWDVNLSHQWCWRLKCSGMWLCVAEWVVADVRRLECLQLEDQAIQEGCLKWTAWPPWRWRHYIPSRHQEILIQQLCHIPEACGCQYYVRKDLTTTHTKTHTHTLSLRASDKLDTWLITVKVPVSDVTCVMFAQQYSLWLTCSHPKYIKQQRIWAQRNTACTVLATFWL